MLSSRVCLRTMTLKPVAKALSMKSAARASFNTSLKVKSSGAWTPSSATAEKSACRLLDTWSGGKMMRSKVALTSADVMGAPSWNFTPSRSGNVKVLPSDETSHEVASPCAMMPRPGSVGSFMTRRSNSGHWGVQLFVVPDWCISRCGGLAANPYSSQPPR